MKLQINTIMVAAERCEIAWLYVRHFAIENNYIGYAIVNLLDYSFKKQVLITYKTHAHSQLSVILCSQTFQPI